MFRPLCPCLFGFGADGCRRRHSVRRMVFQVKAAGCASRCLLPHAVFGCVLVVHRRQVFPVRGFCVKGAGVPRVLPSGGGFSVFPVFCRCYPKGDAGQGMASLFPVSGRWARCAGCNHQRRCGWLQGWNERRGAKLVPCVPLVLLRPTLGGGVYASPLSRLSSSISSRAFTTSIVKAGGSVVSVSISAAVAFGTT